MINCVQLRQWRWQSQLPALHHPSSVEAVVTLLFRFRFHALHRSATSNWRDARIGEMMTVAYRFRIDVADISVITVTCISVGCIIIVFGVVVSIVLRKRYGRVRIDFAIGSHGHTSSSAALNSSTSILRRLRRRRPTFSTCVGTRDVDHHA
jgi:hypothetical protein